MAGEMGRRTGAIPESFHSMLSYQSGSSAKKEPYRLTLGLTLTRMSRAAILAKPSTIPEFVITASGQRFSAALRSLSKSSWVIFTFTCTTRFMRICMKDFQLTGNDTFGTVSTQFVCLSDLKIRKGTRCETRRAACGHRPAWHRKWTAMTITSGAERRQRTL